MSKTIKLSLLYSFTLLILFIPSQLYGEVYGVTCSDGSHHPPGFDCEAYIRAKIRRESNSVNDSERIYQRPDNREKQWEKEQELEWQRQQQLRDEEARNKREEESQRQFEQDKQKALKMLKSEARKLGLKDASGGGLKLKGERANEPTLKEPLFSKGYKGSAPPYLGDLDPKWPIVVDLGKVQGGTPEALRKANRRTHVLLDALEAGAGSWEATITYLKNRLAASPEDLAVRDALNFVRGLYQGYLNSKNRGDHYFKYGVRHWIEKDYDMAARAFAQVIYENPDDIAAYRTFAYTLGLRDGTNQCGRSTCQHIEVPKKSTFDFYNSSVLKELRRDVRRNPRALQQRALLNLWEGMAAYQNWLNHGREQKAKPPTSKAQKLFDQGVKRYLEEDYFGAMRAFAEGYKISEDARGILFTKEYSGGLAAASLGEAVDQPRDPRIKKAYDELMQIWDKAAERELNFHMQQMAAEAGLPSQKDYRSLQEALKDVNNRNPFFGTLPSEEVKRLQKEKMI
jgi:hypothetical protein